MNTLKTKALLSTLFLTLLSFTSAKAQVPQVEKDALIDFYNATDGDNWVNNTNWNTVEPVDTWYGVVVENDHVVVIDLSYNEVSGTIPATITNLDSLINFQVRNNSLDGDILTYILTFDRLGTFNIAFNNFTGSIPAEIDILSNLSVFIISANQFEGELPVGLGNLPELQELYLANNNFTGELPAELTNLSSLNEFWISGNQFTGAIPDGFNDMDLDIFNIYNNQFDELPFLGDLFDGFPTFDYNIRFNNFTFEDLELNIGHLNQVNYSSMNPISAPDTLFVVSGGDLFYEFYVGGANNMYQWYKNDEPWVGETGTQLILNDISDSDTGRYYLEITNSLITDLTIVTETIEVQYGDFVSGVPASEYNALVALYNATDGENWTNNTNWLGAEPVSNWAGVGVENQHVIGISLSSNNLAGSIPAEIGNLTEIKSIWMDYNELAGNIPPEIGNLPVLEGLIIDFNQIDGSIPTTIGNLLTLQVLGLDNNQLSGELPPEIGNLVNLWVLDLSNNNLTGTIPVEFGNLVNMESMFLGENQLSGTIPAELANCTNLIGLWLNSNQLIGDYPDELGQLSDMLNLNLDSNQLENLPDLSAMADLVFLRLRSNRFTFEDLENNLVADNNFYAPQALIPGPGPIVINAGNELSIQISVGGAFNQYQWYKDGIAIEGATSDLFYKASASASDAGIYTLEIINTIATELTLSTEQITVDIVTGIASVSPLSEFNIYPNPASDYIIVEAAMKGQIRFTITDHLGKLIYVDRAYSFLNNDQIKINISALPAGDYILTIITDQTKYSRSFIKK